MVVTLEPWTVYGALEESDCTGSSCRIGVPDIGVLPPAGRYVGRVICDGVERLARFTVFARDPERGSRTRFLHVDLESLGLTTPPVPIALVFEGVELPAEGC